MFTIPTRLSQLFWQSHYSNIFWSTIPTQYYSDRTVWGGCSKLRHYSNMFTIPTFSSILFWQIIISTIPRTIPWTPKCGNLPCVAASYCARSAPRKFWLYWSAFTTLLYSDTDSWYYSYGLTIPTFSVQLFRQNTILTGARSAPTKNVVLFRQVYYSDTAFMTILTSGQFVHFFHHYSDNFA